MPPARRRPSPARLATRHAVWLAIAGILGLLLLVTKGRAAPPAAAFVRAPGYFAPDPKGGEGEAKPTKPTKEKHAKKEEAADAGAADGAAPIAASAGADAGASDAGTSDAGAGDAAPLTGLDYAEEQTEADFPAGATEEQKASIGAGKVPIHREGAFRSPFAHPRFGGPASVKVGLVLSQVRGYDIQHGTFDADFFLSLTSDKAMPPLHLTFPNGDDMKEEVIADTPTFKFFRYSGTFTSDVDLRLYPFDSQKLDIDIEDTRAGVDQLVFAADQNRTSLDSTFLMAGWGIQSLAAKAYKHKYPPRFDRDDLYVSRYRFTLAIDRFATSAAFSVFVPALIIVLISLTGLWVPPAELEVRSNTGAPMLAAAVLFHYTLNQALPSTGYLTRADKLMLGVYIALLLNMLSTWVFMLVEEEKLDIAFRVARAVVPPVTVAVMCAAVFL